MFSETSFPLGTASPLPPFTSGSCLAFFASSFRGLSSSGFLFFLTRWEISVTQFDEEAPSVGFLLAIMETEEPPPPGVKPEVELSTRVAFRASSATFPLR
uniref:Nuclear autoantigenic sperm protein n=1 Tax=Pan troglodytes TaxID=9598 RepID=G2HFA4_PANTR|nr:nuclear autoantigenic sperm protein [Pan troglodytes]